MAGEGVSRVLFQAVIALSGLPGVLRPGQPFPLLGLAPGGGWRAFPCCQGKRWALTPPFHPCLAPCGAFGGLFSVPLSVALRRPGVTRHPALWCPDFPPLSGRPPSSPARVKYKKEKEECKGIKIQNYSF